jgi:hypothetical protein
VIAAEYQSGNGAPIPNRIEGGVGKRCGVDRKFY